MAFIAIVGGLGLFFTYFWGLGTLKPEPEGPNQRPSWNKLGLGRALMEEDWPYQDPSWSKVRYFDFIPSTDLVPRIPAFRQTIETHRYMCIYLCIYTIERLLV